MEVVQTETMIFFRYISAILYRDYDVVDEEKFFLDEEEAIAYWNHAISSYYTMIPNTECLAVTA